MGKPIKRLLMDFKRRFWNTRTAKFLNDVWFVVANVLCLFFSEDKTVFLIFFVSSFVFYRIISALIKAVDEVNSEMPDFKRRFTKKREDGSIVIENGMLNEAILYLYALEEYIEKGR